MSSLSARAAAPALGAALLFGASTPLAKLLVGEMPSLLLAGLLYLGSGLGLGSLMLLRRLRSPAADGRPSVVIPRADVPWLAGAIVAGGMLGPALLMAGLVHTGAAAASLLLNLEAVLTAVIAWWVFKENADRRIVAGMLAIVAGGVLLAWEPGAAGFFSTGALLIAAACACWAVDNNLTRKVSANDALLIAGLKGLVAGSVNTGLALAGGADWPAVGTVAAALGVGFVGYGLSLALFVVGLRTLGTARTGAYFSLAPLFGVVLSLALWPALPGAVFWLALVLMAAGTALHLLEHHEHEHSHVPQAHAHPHVHDAHHRHPHDFAWDGHEPHNHPHVHAALRHAHPHVPDIHHRHTH